MKTRLLVMVGMVISTTIFAQKSEDNSRNIHYRGYERMKRELALTDKQYASVKDIDSKYSKKRDDERAKFMKRRMEERETMRSMQLERQREMRKVFTPEQNKKWDELREARKNDHRLHNGRHRHESRHRKFHKGDHRKRHGGERMERKG
ncbi:MAG TPA: hypothetical protein PK325_17415 [Cyclobacteriaceae bacterium]|nr:hypothetical protein [Cyclobacteriaceae bacterium]HMV07250.1 hypothetical protein [Cyclobacteriaceae bacterium]HMV88565.1 hypothetical protein [Cyclobacteriaceae bacterium]HMW99395.1 hypothetical protein [Cyclobacteriaceae bacterium]HMX48816.1 hypothetical protein [Cyclobacteriaceae bacterium]